MKLKYILEATSSGQESGAFGVAGTDTRFGGTTYEPVYFAKPMSYRKLDTEFWESPQTLLNGWKYAFDRVKKYKEAVDMDITPKQAVDQDITADTDKELKDMRKETWKDADYDKHYKDLIRRLRKEHNI